MTGARWKQSLQVNLPVALLPKSSDQAKKTKKGKLQGCLLTQIWNCTWQYRICDLVHYDCYYSVLFLNFNFIYLFLQCATKYPLGFDIPTCQCLTNYHWFTIVLECVCKLSLSNNFKTNSIFLAVLKLLQPTNSRLKFLLKCVFCVPITSLFPGHF